MPLYTPGDIKNRSENRNWDICVSNYVACAVAVVNAAGQLRFRYTRFPSFPQIFYPFGITTDSQANILIADFDDNCIHIIDQNDKLLHYIYRCGLQDPWGLSVDSKDNLLVTEWVTGKVKKIKYYKW